MAASTSIGHTRSSVTPRGRPDDDELYIVWCAKERPDDHTIKKIAWMNDETFEKAERRLFGTFRTSKVMSGFYNVG